MHINLDEEKRKIVRIVWFLSLSEETNKRKERKKRRKNFFYFSSKLSFMLVCNSYASDVLALFLNDLEGECHRKKNHLDKRNLVLYLFVLVNLILTD